MSYPIELFVTSLTTRHRGPEADTIDRLILAQTVESLDGPVQAQCDLDLLHRLNDWLGGRGALYSTNVDIDRDEFRSFIVFDEENDAVLFKLFFG